MEGAQHWTCDKPQTSTCGNHFLTTSPFEKSRSIYLSIRWQPAAGVVLGGLTCWIRQWTISELWRQTLLALESSGPCGWTVWPGFLLNKQAAQDSNIMICGLVITPVNVLHVTHTHLCPIEQRLFYIFVYDVFVVLCTMQMSRIEQESFKSNKWQN